MNGSEYVHDSNGNEYVFIDKMLTLKNYFASFKRYEFPRVIETNDGPHALKIIGKSAFAGKSLVTLCFQKNSKLYRIQSNAFQFSFIKSITIPKSVKIIEPGAFYSRLLWKCDLEPENAIYIQTMGSIYRKHPFTLLFVQREQKNLILRSPLLEIAPNACYHCRLVSIQIPSSVKRIEDLAFGECFELERVTFSKNSHLEHIGNNAFYNCTKLRKFKFPSALKSIGDLVFENDIHLKNVDFFHVMQTLNEFPENIFLNCTSLILDPEILKFRFFIISKK